MRVASNDLPGGAEFHFTPSPARHIHHELELHARGQQLGKLSWGQDGDISGVEVHHQHRRQGIATALYTRAHELSREHRIEPPGASVFQTGAGHAFRTSFDVGERPDVSHIPTHLHRGAGEHDTDLHEHLIKHHYPASADMVHSWDQETAEKAHDQISRFSPCGWGKTGAMEGDAMASDADQLKFHHEEWQSGGSLYPNEERITAHHPERGAVGSVHFLRGKRINSPILIKKLDIGKDHRRRGYGSALMDQLQAQYPKAKINHGDRTDDGKAWWKSYGQGADRRGRTSSRPFDHAARLGDGRICQGCAGIGELHDGHECGACDGSGRDPECICGREVAKQPGEDWWSHLDGSISHDYEDKVPQDEHGPLGVADCMRMLGKTELPTKRLFGPTYGLDHRLFDGDCLRDDVTEYVLGTLGRFWEPLYGPNWRKWARVYLAGSEASEWTSETLEGNNDFDVLIGIEYDDMRDDMKSRPGLDTLFGMMSDEQVTNALNQQFRAGLIPHTDPVMISIDGQETGPWSNTWYVNQDSWDITKIKPYAAYDVTNHRWAVRPPHLPSWDISQFPEGHALVQECKAVEAYVRAVLRLPEPYRAQQADSLWKHLHGDRSRAFGPQGEGWYDPGNVLEKFLDQKGIWEPLAQAHFDAVADPSRLLAPSDWSNDPVSVTAPPR
jgi:GNAT superfamily N-acetyltransferase